MTHNGGRPTVVLRCKEVLRKVRLSRATVYRLMAKKKFPQQRHLSEGAVGWSEAEVNAWLAVRFPTEEGNGTGSKDTDG